MSDTLVGLIITFIFIVISLLSGGESNTNGQESNGIKRRSYRRGRNNFSHTQTDLNRNSTTEKLKFHETNSSQINIEYSSGPSITQSNISTSKKDIKDRYPNYIKETVDDSEFMNFIIEESYKNEFIDLKKLHKSLNEDQFLKISLYELQELNLSKDRFWSDDKNDFWFINYNNLNFIFNGSEIIPCSKLWRNDFATFTGVLYIPTINKFKVRDSTLMDCTDQLFQTVIEKLITEDDLYVFLQKMNYYYDVHEKPHQYNLTNIVWVSYSKLTHKKKLNILFKLNSLDFITQLYLVRNNYFKINFEKLIYSLYNLEQIKILDIVKLSDTSRGIIKQEEFEDILLNHLNEIDDIFSFFEYDKIEEFVEEYFPRYHFKKKVCVLNHEFFYFHYNTNVYKRNYEGEKYLKEKLNEFKSKYYRSIREKLRQFENENRVSKGYNIVGTFTNESILYNKIKDSFSEIRVVSQGSPDWLGRQRIDIYLPDYNIGVEYHGDQHFIPIGYFGGEEGLIYRKELDERKERLCKENDCKLFVVDKTYEFETLILEIEQEINLRMLKKIIS